MSINRCRDIANSLIVLLFASCAELLVLMIHKSYAMSKAFAL